MPRYFIVLLVLSLSVAFAACGDDGDGPAGPTATGDDGTDAPTGPAATVAPTANPELSAVEAAVRAQTDAFNRADAGAFVALYADAFISDQLGVTREQALALVTEFIGEPQIEIVSISGTSVTGETATTLVESHEGVILSRERYSLVRENGAWLVAGIEELPVEPAGDVVDLQMNAGSRFSFDQAAVTSGDFAFHVVNADTQPHEVVLLGGPGLLDLISPAVLGSPETLPDGVETLGLFGPLDPGAEADLVFGRPLAPGRYAMTCFITDESGQTHGELGMIAEFTVSE
jgi:hypothetical protein